MKHLVAVYGTLKKWYHNHRVMENAKWILHWEDYVQVKQLKDVGFPCVKFSKDSDKWLKVEVYEVEEKFLHILDQLEWYRKWSSNNHYVRIEVETLTDEKVYVYEYNSKILEVSNTLEKHFDRAIVAPRFYDWNRNNI